MGITSYSQNLEDVILWRVLKNIKNGFYIDVGAAWCNKDSVTKAFYDHGWTGINIEPNQKFIEQYTFNRPKDINLGIALSDKTGTSKLYLFDNTGLSSLNSDIAKSHVDVGYKTTISDITISTLEDICAEYVQKKDIHFLKVDVEGFEKSVLLGNDWKKYRPWIILLEAISPRSQEENYEEWEYILIESEYTFVYADGLNRFYLAKEHNELLSAFKYPPNVFDEYSLCTLSEAETKANEAEVKMIEAETKANEAETKASEAETKANKAETKATILEKELDKVHQSNHYFWTKTERQQAELNKIMNSNSWKVTKPLRVLRRGINWFAVRSISWITFAPNSRPRRILKHIINKSIDYIVHKPHLKKKVLTVLNYFPRVKYKLKFMKIHNDNIGKKDFNLVESDTKLKMSILGKENKIIQKRVVLFYAEFTASLDAITGVTRVCQKLSINLANDDIILIIVKLNKENLSIVPLEENELDRYSKTTGFLLKENDKKYYNLEYFKDIYESLVESPVQNWLIIPEVTYHSYHNPQPTSRLIKEAKDHGLKVGVVFYDNIPLISNYAQANAFKHMRYLSDISLADIIWPISNYAGESLYQYYVQYEKLSAQQMPAIVVAALPDEKDSERIVPEKNNNSNMILCLGTIDERKNQITLVKAFNYYCTENPNTTWTLILVGHLVETIKDALTSEIKNNKNIEIVQDATDKDIDILMNRASFTVFPSLEEGYGLPIVESLWHMRPCICANFGSMKDLSSKGGCLTVDVRNKNELYKAIDDMIHNKDLYWKKVKEIVARPVSTWWEYSSDILVSMAKYHTYNQFNGIIYLWVDATVNTPGNSGIQRLTRQLSRTLLEQTHKIVPIKWDEKKEVVILATEDDLEHLAKWNGPDVDLWHMKINFDDHSINRTYLLSDLPLNRSLSIQQNVIDYFKGNLVKCASIFYDAIPHKMDDIYPANFTAAHREYMTMLDQFDHIYSISNYSNNDLFEFLNKYAPRGLSLDNRLLSVTLPEEFPLINNYDEFIPDPNCCNILSVGTIEPRKNHIKLIEAFLEAEKISKKKLKLVLIGSNNSFCSELEGQVKDLIKRSESITWITNANDIELKENYIKSDFTIFSSSEEGFGLPIVESLWFGKPCICADFGQMAELSKYGGCLTTNVLNSELLCDSIVKLANNEKTYLELKSQIKDRYFRTWDDYAGEISNNLNNLFNNSKPIYSEILANQDGSNMIIPQRPLLSVCITTYQREEWIKLNIDNFLNVSKGLENIVELIVCDNSSSYSIENIIIENSKYKNVNIYQNSGNIGMLNNLSQTVSLADGEYIWLVGDDDVIHQGSLEKIIEILNTHKPDLINLNYKYNNEINTPNIGNLNKYLNESTIICNGKSSHLELLKNVSAYNENFYTAIYTFITKKTNSLRIFNQDTSGGPFSNMQTCVPSTKYIFTYLSEVDTYWENNPLITINLNVSWGEFAPIWILERIPEVYDYAELNGVAKLSVDKWRSHTLDSAVVFFNIIYTSETPEKYNEFDFIRFVRRNKHLDSFENIFLEVFKIYQEAYNNGHVLALYKPEEVKDFYNAAD